MSGAGTGGKGEVAADLVCGHGQSGDFGYGSDPADIKEGQ